MTISRLLALSGVGLLLASSLLASGETTLPPLSTVQAIVSVADQKIAVLRDGQVIAKYPISTSRFGVGDRANSYMTPLGTLKVYEKLGDNLPQGAVIKHRRATGEVISVNAPGRDPIVTRILWLDGTEPQNEHAKERSIYIHGTPEEKLIGRPASYGCIRMRSKDVVSLYEDLAVGSAISIIPDKLPRIAKYQAPSAREIAKAAAAKDEKEKQIQEEAAKQQAQEDREKLLAKEEKEKQLAKEEREKQLAKEEREKQLAKAAEPVPARAPTITPSAKAALAAARAETEKTAQEARLASARTSKPAPAPTPEPRLTATSGREAERKSADTKNRVAAAQTAEAPVALPAPKPIAAAAPTKKEPVEAAAVPALRLNVKSRLASSPEDSAKLAKADASAPRKTAALPTPASTRSAPAIAELSLDSRSTTMRKRNSDARPPVVLNQVDPDRLAFIKNHEASLAAARATPEMINRTESPSSGSSTMDLSGRMKGSILDTGLTR